MHGLLKGFTVYYRAMREWEVGEVLNETTEGKGFTLTGLQPYQNYTLQVSNALQCCLRWEIILQLFLLSNKRPHIKDCFQKGGGIDIRRGGNAEHVRVLPNQGNLADTSGRHEGPRALPRSFS